MLAILTVLKELILRGKETQKTLRQETIFNREHSLRFGSFVTCHLTCRLKL